MRRPRIAVALGSGAGRGWAHIGVLRALQREGIPIDIVCGTSVGALVGGSWLGGHLDTLESWSRGLNRLRLLRYLDVSLSGGSLIGGRRLDRLLHESLRELAIERLEMPFAAVATELDTGHEIWLQRGPLVQALKASYALPGVFPPVRVNGRWLVDGALVNPVPVSVCRAMGARMVIAVNLNADLIGRDRTPRAAEPHRPDAGGGEDDADEAAPPADPGGILNMLVGRHGGRTVFEVMAASLNILQDRLGRSRLAGDPPDVTIAPRVGHIGLLEFDRAGEAIAEGEAAVERARPLLLEALTVLGV